MKPNNTKIVTPSPYYQIAFGCSNRAFYNVKNELYQIGEDIGIDPQDGYMDESCDYEGDLEKIRVYREERSKEFVKSVLDHYEVTDIIPENMDIVLSIF